MLKEIFNKLLGKNDKQESELDLLKESTEIFLKDFRELVEQGKQEEVQALIKFMANSIQCELATKCFYNDRNPNVDYMRAIVNSFQLEIPFGNQETCEKKVTVKNTPIIACVWHHSRMIDGLVGLGERKGNPFDGIKYKWNIHAIMIEPLGLVIVDNGNHSTNAAIMYGEGELIVDAVVDITSALKKYRFDGKHYIEIETNEIATIPYIKNGSEPFNYTIGLLYEMARVFAERKGGIR